MNNDKGKLRRQECLMKQNLNSKHRSEDMINIYYTFNDGTVITASEHKFTNIINNER